MRNSFATGSEGAPVRSRTIVSCMPRALVRTALASVDADRVVGLRVQSDNTAAVSLYRKLGFRERI